MTTQLYRQIFDQIKISNDFKLSFDTKDGQDYELYGIYKGYPVIVRARTTKLDEILFVETGVFDCINWDERITSIKLIREYDVEKAIQETGLELDN